MRVYKKPHLSLRPHQCSSMSCCDSLRFCHTRTHKQRSTNTSEVKGHERLPLQCCVKCVDDPMCVCENVNMCVSVCLESGGRGYLKVTGYYHLNIFLIMTITCSRSELSDKGHQAGVVDSYLETQCTEQFAAPSQTNWIWATLDWGPRLLGVWILKSATSWLAVLNSLYRTKVTMLYGH